MSEAAESHIRKEALRTSETMAMRAHDRNAEIGLPSARVLAKHAGEWVAVVNRKIIAFGKDYRQVVTEAEQASKGKEPSLLHVPSNDILLL
ncbi:MAG: hypothetical protein JRN54_01890 [Nitrososphaerota archaeon]|jgi:hypothetical protein|nr:hypothetical protein [Nitrososphaerota archaeon]